MKRLMIQLDKCTGCKRCEQACIAEHSETKSYIGALLEPVEQFTRIFVETARQEKAVPNVCRHCVEPLCVSACMAGCMQKDSTTGVVTNVGHEQECVGCWMCIMSCPFGVITSNNGMEEVGASIFGKAVKCDFCPDRATPACVASCPDEAISVVDA